MGCPIPPRTPFTGSPHPDTAPVHVLASTSLDLQARGASAQSGFVTGLFQSPPAPLVRMVRASHLARLTNLLGKVKSKSVERGPGRAGPAKQELRKALPSSGLTSKMS